MRSVGFDGQNHTFAVSQVPYKPLPCHITPDGIVTTCWSLTPWERVKTLLTGRVWAQVLSFNKPLQPMKLTTVEPVIVDLAWPRSGK